MRILVISASLDSLNNNAPLREYVANGFKSLIGEDSSYGIDLDNAEKAIAIFRPTLVVIFGSCMPDHSGYLEVKKICNDIGAPIAFWLHDDPYEFDYSFKAEEIADWIFSNDRWASLHYRHDKVFHLPLGACEVAHYRAWTPQKKYQIFFCGVAFPNRVQLVSDLSKIMSRYATFICGREWPILGSFISNQSVANQELPSLVASSMITLNIGRSFNLANERFKLDPSTPGPRTFEAAMAGTVQLYFSDSLEIEDYFVPDQEILLFDSPSSFELQVERLLDQPDLAAKIALAAQKRALAEHTYKNRCTRLLQCCGLI